MFSECATCKDIIQYYKVRMQEYGSKYRVGYKAKFGWTSCFSNRGGPDILNFGNSFLFDFAIFSCNYQHQHLVQFLYLLHHIHYCIICYQNINIKFGLFLLLLLLIMMTTGGCHDGYNSS